MCSYLIQNKKVPTDSKVMKREIYAPPPTVYLIELLLSFLLLLIVCSHRLRLLNWNVLDHAHTLHSSSFIMHMLLKIFEIFLFYMNKRVLRINSGIKFAHLRSFRASRCEWLMYWYDGSIETFFEQNLKNKCKYIY